jgi:hypothetical protein
METDARKVASGDKFGYTGLRRGVKMEILDKIALALPFHFKETETGCIHFKSSASEKPI